MSLTLFWVTFQTFHSIPRVKKNRKNFFCFFFTNWVILTSKMQKKNFDPIFRLWGHPDPRLRIFLKILKIFDFFFRFFFRIESFWVQKNDFFLAHYEVRPIILACLKRPSLSLSLSSSLSSSLPLGWILSS